MTRQPTDSFVPLTAAPAPPDRQEFRVHLIPAAEKKETGFHSLESQHPAALAAAEKKTCEPRVTVQRDAGQVTHLRIQCSCGQILELACVYDPAAPAA